MIVERMTHLAKRGCRKELIELLKEARKLEGNEDLKTRIYSTTFGTWAKVTWDLEFETEEDRKKYWAGIDVSRPEPQEFLKKLYDLTESGHTRELLNLH